MYQKFQQEALANVKEGGYRNKEEALAMYRYYVRSLYRMARDGYYMFQRNWVTRIKSCVAKCPNPESGNSFRTILN